MKPTNQLLACLAALATSTAIAAQAPAEQAKLSPDEIAVKSQQVFYYAGQDLAARVQMKLISAGGQERRRDLLMLRRNSDSATDTGAPAGASSPALHPAGRQQYFLYFRSPPDVRGTAFLVCKEPGRDADRWLFIPALNLVQRIAARDAESSFVGSDFSYEDVSGRPLGADSRRLLPEESLPPSVARPPAARACYLVESIPKGRAGFRRKLAWIDQTSFLPLREEYYDAQGQLFKVFTADEVRSVDGVPTAVRRTMNNVKSGHRTEVVFSQVQYNSGLAADLFTERSLRRPPAQWIAGE
jgi:hypothetical protein